MGMESQAGRREQAVNQGSFSLQLVTGYTQNSPGGDQNVALPGAIPEQNASGHCHPWRVSSKAGSPLSFWDGVTLVESAMVAWLLLS